MNELAEKYPAGAHLSDQKVADQVRMLMRDDPRHEAICVIGRDRIMMLSEDRDCWRSVADSYETERLEQKAEIERLRAALEQHAIVQQYVNPAGDDERRRWMCQLCCAGNGSTPTDLLHEESCLLYRADPSVERTQEGGDGC